MLLNKIIGFLSIGAIARTTVAKPPWHINSLREEAEERPLPPTGDYFSSRTKHDIESDPDKKVPGENHNPLNAPKGSRIASIRVNPGGGEEIPVYLPKTLSEEKLEHIYIVIHGKYRDGDHYWKVLNDIIKEGDSKTSSRARKGKVAVAAPLFLSEKYNAGGFTDSQLAWDDVNAWQPGGRATHPHGTRLSSIDALDGLIQSFIAMETYPKLTNVTIVGHGGGGQLAQRYAVVGKTHASHVYVRYIHSDASSCVYFTENRTRNKENKVDTSSCENYNSWRYGFKGFPGTSDGLKKPGEYFQQYISRDVVSIVGHKDVKTHGDQSCMARLQGGEKRRNRNLTWYRYIHTLARTTENLKGFPGKFADMPDWSEHAKGGHVKLRLAVVKDADHDVKSVLESKVGQSALFNDGDISTEWWPN